MFFLLAFDRQQPHENLFLEFVSGDGLLSALINYDMWLHGIADLRLAFLVRLTNFKKVK